MANSYIVRLISSKDHAISKEELLAVIRATGSDRYDENRKQLFNKFYKKHNVDFFGTLAPDGQLDATLQRLKHEFAAKSRGDRGQSVVPDVAILYKADRCEMVEYVYEGVVESDCFRFKTDAKDAFKDVQEV